MNTKAVLIAPIVAVDMVVIATAAIIAIGLTETTITNANASIIGSFGQGYDAGKSVAYRTFNSGGYADASCPYDFSSYISWCTGYHTGYNEEWAALQAAQP